MPTATMNAPAASRPSRDQLGQPLECRAQSVRLLCHGPMIRFMQSMALFGIGQQKPHHYREMAEDRVGEPRSVAVRVAHSERRRLRRMRARHVRPLGLDAAGRPSLHGPTRADAAQHGARRSTRRSCPTCPRSRRSARSSFASLAACRSRCFGGTASLDFSWRPGTKRSIGSRKSCAASIRSARPSISRRAASPTRCTTPRRRRRGFWAARTSTTRRGCVTPRRRPR